ncbi:cytochrome c oxidase, cbb3-type subunit III [Helicobacter enhydrae]|uniref:Cytochrome c oxidase subunit III n=1 Tax=Helicobacter enhydrae TaxID=222136 RepID=A0A1B1U5Y7_9HELI|nr:cytochrome-c oxidase, cbb3-type subunit III [Helicobacter enhydrae]ANV98105.1 cytochrome c oxidase, cbb3-type subunit III [Helicobacter enhydrae]
MFGLNLSDHVIFAALTAAFVILALTAYVVNLYIKKMKVTRPEGKLAEEEWDGIQKFKNNLPLGWTICFVVAIVWGFWYIFVGYPINAFSQIGQYNADVADYNKQYSKKLANLTQEQLVEMGQNIFLVQCSQCHGVTANGLAGKAQNLTQWGKEEGIMNTIMHGSKGLDLPLGEMPPVEMSESDARAVASYIMADISDVKHTKYPTDVAKGKEVFNTAGCTGCHGEDGKGMDGSAADLSTYGTPKFLAYILNHGKKGMIGQMPSFAYAGFSEIQIKALSAFIESLEPNGQ